MLTSGISTRNAGYYTPASKTKVAHTPVANRVQDTKSLANRVQHQGVANRVEGNQSVQNRVNIAA